MSDITPPAPDLSSIETREQAIDAAVEWQSWMAERSLSMSEVIEWQGHFEALAAKFDLTDEFRENGVI